LNDHLKSRLEAMQRMLLGAYSAGNFFGNVTKGAEREAFLNSFLAEILPPPFRFGMGEATDQAGRKSGQLDIVVEFPFVPSLPLISGRSPRLYLAEGIVAVIEVKSNLAAQWSQVAETAASLAKLSRKFGSGIAFGPKAGERIPLYAVGYIGWKEFKVLKQNVLETPEVSGALVIESGNFIGRYDFIGGDNKADTYRYERESSPMALWGLISCLSFAGSMVASTAKDVPRKYDDA
jgi:hypothetical protein